jgi:hypothetical protein
MTSPTSPLPTSSAGPLRYLALTDQPYTETPPENPQTFIESGPGFCISHRPKWRELTCPQRLWYV